MIAKSDIVILSTASALLLIALLRLGEPDTDLRSARYYTTPKATAQLPNVMGQVANPQSTNNAGTTNQKVAVVSTQTVTPAEIGTEDFKQPDVIREASFRTHIVKQGEYLSLIAKRYSTTVSDLKRLNNLSGTTILVGQELVYPYN